jgi:hypothetical protein
VADGGATAEVIRAAVNGVDPDLVRRVGPEYAAHARAALAALVDAGRHPGEAADD